VRPIPTLVLLGILLGAAPVRADELGTISFPNSGAPEAQEAFLRGVKALHSFQFDEARFAFQDAQRIDPDFALAYWGQAMSDNHPLWAQQDRAAAEAALERLAPTLPGRLAKASTDKEKAWLRAVEILYFSPGDKLERDRRYARHLEAMHERWPDDHEVAVFRALALLGTVRPGDRGFRRQAQAAAIALEVFRQNPRHPGAAHFVIHAFDDPDHAILALPAARVYADIAPAAAHALHMPSHIFLQLGHWDRVVASNIDAYAAAVAANEKYGLPEGREDFHTLSWLAYGNLMLGRAERARENLARAREAVERNPGNERVRRGWLNMRARHMLETGTWEALPLDDADVLEGRHGPWVAAVGTSAARRGDLELAAAAAERLAALGRSADGARGAYAAKELAVLERQVRAERLAAAGDLDGALAVAEEAAELEVATLRMPSGPPIPMKPAIERHAELLAAAGRSAEAVDAFERALAWVPQRTPALLGLARAAERAGREDLAERTWAALRGMPGADPEAAPFAAAAAAAGGG
jgi:tetratricopeptide (TPR) repeat protein